MQNIIVVTFAVESEGYMATTQLRHNPTTSDYMVSEAVLVKRTDRDVNMLDSFGTDALVVAEPVNFVADNSVALIARVEEATPEPFDAVLQPFNATIERHEATKAEEEAARKAKRQARHDRRVTALHDTVSSLKAAGDKIAATVDSVADKADASFAAKSEAAHSKVDSFAAAAEEKAAKVSAQFKADVDTIFSDL